MADLYDEFDLGSTPAAAPDLLDEFGIDAPKKPGVLGTLKEGTKSAGRALGATANTYTGNAQGVIDKAETQQYAPKNEKLQNFYDEVERNTEASRAQLPEGEDVGVLGAIGNVGKAVLDNPAGAGLAVVEQLPNALPTMAAGWAGFKAGGAAGGALGTLAGPAGTAIGGGIGAVVGGLAGMFLGNAAIETGHKAMAAADDGEYTPEEMSQVKREGAIKGGVLTAVDGVTLGLGGAVSGAMQRTARTALESATRKALVDRGVDVTSEAAVLSARSDPATSAAVRAAQEGAVKATDTLKRRAAEAGTLLSMETVGEGVGEYLGELAATGEGNVTDAVLESLLSLGQSGAETAWNMSRKRDQRGMWEEAAAIADPSLGQANEPPAPAVGPQDPAPAPTPSERMGINPNAGPLSSAAAVAVDSGAAQQVAQQAALQQAAEAAQQPQSAEPAAAAAATAPNAVPEGVDPVTGEVMAPAIERAEREPKAQKPRTEQLAETLDYLRRQAKVNGWTSDMLFERDSAQAELDALQPKQEQPQGKAKEAAKQDQATEWTDKGVMAEASQEDNAVALGGLKDLVNAGRISQADADTIVQRAMAAARKGHDRAIAGDYIEEAVERISGIYGNRGAGTASTIEWAESDRQVLANEVGPLDIAELRVKQPAQIEQSAAPQTLQQGIAQARAEKAEDAAAPADIKAIIDKQIPAMTDAEIDQAIAHYGPKHKRTAKLKKERIKRAKPQEKANATEPQGTGTPIQAATGTQAAPQQEQPATAPQSQADQAATVDDVETGTRWAAMSEAERKAVVERADVKLNQVQRKNLPNAEWERIGPAVREKLVAAISSQAQRSDAPSIEGENIDGDWATFSKESGTLGVPRAKMPQIKAEHRGAMVNFLNARGIAHQEEAIPAADLKPTQAEFSREKVKQAREFTGGNRSILVSADGHVLDGHHQWLASREQGEDVKAIRLDAPMRELLQAAHEFPSSTTAPAQASEKPATSAKAEKAPASPATTSTAPEHLQVGVDEREQQTNAPTGITTASVIDNGATNPGEYIVRYGTSNMARFELSAKGQPVRVKYFSDAGANRNLADRAIQQFMDERSSTPATAAAAPDAETKAKDADRFSSNKIFTADAVAAARARMKSKLGQLNSGIDPELMMDGMTIAGAYIESGVRDFAQYAAMMSDDFGDKIKPYLLSFWEAARNYPGVNKDGMTSAAESARLHAELLTPAVATEVTEAVGTVAEKPKARSKKTGAKGDMVLTQDWGTEHINGYGESNDRETGNDTKDAFLKDARTYLNAVADALRALGFEPHLDRKGKAEKPVSVNEAGPAVSGDVSLVMRNEDNGNNVYITIGDSSLRGIVPATPSGIAIMYRVGPGTDRYASKAGNTWAPVDLSANDLAALVNSRVRPAQENEARNEQPANGAQDQGRAQDVRGGGRDPQPGSAPADSGDVDARQSADGGQAGEAGDSGRPGIRQPGADVASGATVPGGRNADDGRAGAGGAGASDAGAGNAGSARAENSSGGRSGDIADAVSAAGLILGGTPTDRKFKVSLPGYEYANAVLTRDGDLWAMTSRGLENAVTGTLAEALAAAKTHMERVRSGPPAPQTSPAATGVQAQDLHIDNPLEIVGGTPVQRFNRNRAALELLQSLEEEGRQANPEEQKILAGYIGWGSFGQELFQGSWERPVYRDEGIWKERGEWLRGALGESAWKSAQRSITNAHYTDPPTVMAMWDMVRRMGFMGGKVQEPSLGTGNFFSMMPADFKARSQLTGIELDETTGAIAKQLFPKSNVRVMGYEQSQTPDGFYDLIIGNWPFENTPVADRRYNKLNPMLHDYFFLKTLDQVRAGGLVIGITSAGSMDKQNTLIRREMARKAELVASIRLPSGAFQEYAGTKVVTDIVILRKRPERLVAVPSDVNWIETREVDTPSGQKVRVNQYYAENPQHIIGTLDFGSGTTTFRAGMIVHRPENMTERLKQAIDLVPAGAFKESTTTDHITHYANATGERHGALTDSNGMLMVVMGDQMVEASEKAKYQLKDQAKTADRETQLRGVIGLRKLHTALVDAERQGLDAELARKALAKGYADFTKAHGPLRKSFGLSYLERIEDPFFAELAALENDDGKPAAVMSRSTTRGRVEIHNPSVRDAYVLARNQSVNPSLEAIAKIANKPAEDVKAELLDSGAVFLTPTGDIVPSDIYLSGNVREKMREAEAGLAQGNKEMSVNIAALKEVMPEDVPYFNIETKLGATWVSPEHYAGYVAHMLSRDNTKGIEIAFKSSRWSVKLDSELNRAPEASTNFGSKEVTFSRLVQAAMSNQTLRLKSKDADGNETYDAAKSEEANARLSKIREEFGTWLWSDPERRVDMEREYNEARNAWATPKYDGSFLTFEGMALSLGNGEFQLRQHQVNAIWRAIVNRRSINAHEVGTGKTFTMGGIAIESRRYGIAKKPLILAHNANSASVAKEIRMMYPSARILYIDNLEPKHRAVRMRQIANDDWDAIVIPHSLIDRLSLREETLMQMAADDIAELEAEFYDAAAEDGVDVSKIDLDDDESIKTIRSVTAKEMAKARKRIIENIKKQSQASSKEGAIAFEDLGIDMILVDEVHEFKKPPIVTRMQMKGLNTGVSNRSIAMQFLTRYVRQQNNGGNVHTFTGTPITNTITEIYHQMRYVMESEMQQANVADWDGWFGSFATEVSDVELTAAGEYEIATRLAGFVNVPELRQMVGQYMDTVFAEDMPEMQPRRTTTGKQLTDTSLTETERAELLNGRTEGAKDRPYKKVINSSADMSSDQVGIFQHLQQLAREWRDASGKQRKEWASEGDPHQPMIAGGIADKASFDARLIDDSMAGLEGQTNDDPNSKASRAVANVLEIYKSHPLAGQVIFSDMGFNKVVERTRKVGDERIKYKVPVLSTVHDIVERLVQGGIPRNEIAMVTGATKKEQRHEIAQAMNEGTIRVVLGSTDTLGVGVNMQRNLRAMHHMDAPHMPGELEQRNGRGLRQGNQWNTVLEFRYMTERLDGKRWQILAIKQRFINAFMKATGNTRVIEGEAAADEQSDILESFSEAAGDPRILQRVKLQKKLESLQRKERMYAQGIADMRRQARNSTSRAEQLAGRLIELEKKGTLKNIEDLLSAQRESFAAVIDGKTYDKRADAIAALADYTEAEMRVGSDRRQVGTYAGHPISIGWLGYSDSPTTTIEAFGEKSEGKGIAGAEARMRGFAGRVAEAVAERDAAQTTAENMQKAMQQPFGQAADLGRVTKQLEDLEKDLSINPVPPPAWLRQGAPVDSEVFKSGRAYIVAGHRYGTDGWFVIAEDDKGTTLIPYLEATDNVGMPLYDEREFVAPEVMTKDNPAALIEADRVPDGDTRLRFSRNAGATRVRFLDRGAVKQLAIKTMGEATVRNRFVFVSYNELPTDIRTAAEEQGAKPREVEAIYSQGKTYIVDDRFTTLDDARKAMFHEHYVHYGLRAKYGRGLALKLANLMSGLGGLQGVLKMAKEQGIDLAAYERGILGNEKIPASHQPLILTEELLAHLGESTGTLKRMLQEAVGAIRAWLRSNSWASLAELNITDLAHVLRQARKAALEDDSTPPDRPRFRLADQNDQTNSAAFRNWFGDSKVVDKQGEPLSLYHGTAADFTIFENRAGSSTGHSTSDLGYFMTTDRSSAEGYARNASDGMPGLARVMELYATIRNPYTATLAEMQAIESPVQARAFRGKLERAGHDGMYVPSAKAWVAFSNTQIKSATDNVGTFDDFDPDIRFRRSAADIGRSVSDSIKSITVKDVKRSASGKFTDFLGMSLQAIGRRQLVDLYDGLLPMRRYERLVERMEADKNDTGAASDELARRWGKLKDGDKLADLMHEATLAQSDADPMIAADKAQDLEARDVLVRRFNELSPEAQAIYREARDGYKQHHRSVIEAIKERVKRSDMSSERKADLLRQMDSEFYKAIKGVYFPLARFGSYVVAVNGSDGKIVSVHRAETMGEANALRDQLVQRFPKDQGFDVGKVTLDKEFVASRDSVSRGFMSELYGALDGMNLPSSQLAELEDTLGQLYLASMPDLSWAKHGIHRKGTAGFSDDARRAFAQNMFHGARYLAKLRYGDRMHEELDRMQKHADARKQEADYDQPKAQRVIDEMVKRHEALMNPKSHPLSTALTSFGFIYYLGLSPAAAAVNLSQTALVAFPIMGAKWGFTKSAAALMKASNEAVRGKNDITKALAPEELRAFEKAVKDGTIDVTQAHDLAGIAQGEDSKVMWKIRPVMRMASFMFHQAEVFNRQVTFVASFRLAREAGASTTAAYEQAKKATYDGHFDYSSGNRPRLMQGNVAKVVLLFKQYAQNMVYTMARNAYLSVAGESPAVKKEARKVFGAIMALHASAAGVLGLPLVAPILALASALGGDDDEPWDAEVALRNLMADAVGQKPAEVIARGLSRFGPADISGRVSLNNLLLPDVMEGLEGRKLAEAWTMAMLGPVAGIFTNAAVGAAHISEGRYSMGLESMLPVAVRNPIKAFRYADEGVVDRSGVVVRDEVSVAGIASQVVGFSPSEVRLSFEGKSAVFNADRRLATRRTDLLAAFSRASMKGDREGMLEARAEIIAFNEKNPARRIQANHMMQSVKARQRRIALAQDGIYLPSNRADARDAGRFAEVEG